MYTGAGRHLHPYAIHNYNLLTEHTFDVSSWQRDFALTALSNNIDSSGRSIFRSTVPLVSSKLNLIKNNLKEGKLSTRNLIKTETSMKEEKPNRSRRRKKRKTVWTKPKTHSLPAQAAKKIKDENKDNSICDKSSDELDVSSEKDEKLEPIPYDEVKTLKRKLNQNEEDDLHWEMYGTPQKRVKLKLIQTQSEGNKKPQWTSVNTEKESRPEETEEEMIDIVNTVVDAMMSHVEYNTEYNDMEITHDPTYAEEYKLETEDAGDTFKTLKRKRNNSSRVKWELKRLDVLIFEQESEAKNGDGTCSNEFCKLGCICESIQVRPKHRAINHCSKIDCIFKCVCPAPKRNDPKPPIRDESEIIRSIAEKRNGRNLAKKEKEWIQTLVKTNDEYIIMQSTSGNKNKREVKKPERYREESLHWENVAHQKFLYEKVKRSLREKAKKATKDDSSPTATPPPEDSNSNDSSSTVSLKDKKRAELKLLKRLRKKKLRLQEMSQQNSEENKTNKTSPFKFVFCKEHSVLDCKCKAKKETKEDGNDVDEKQKDINEEINTLTNNLKNLTSEEKDKLLSLMREQQTLTETQQQEQSSEGNATENKDETQGSNNNTDEEYIDLNTLSKFIPNPDGEATPDKPKDVDSVKQDVENSEQAKEDSNDSRLSDDIEIVEEDNDQQTNQNTTRDDMPKIKIKSVRSLQGEEFDKMVAEDKKQDQEDDIEVLDDTRTSVTSNGTVVTSRQGVLPKPNSIQNLLSDKSLGGNQTKNIDIYGFMLHNGIGYLPICQYSPQQLYLIFKDPTKRESQSIIFHGTDYLQKASTWANSFLNNYIKFHPKYSPNPVWKIIKFSTTKELGNWKLFDFKFLKDYAPMVLTSEGVYKVKNKILYKLLLVPGHKAVFKFKQVMEAKLDMDDVSFIGKYEYFHNCRDNLPNNRPIRFIQRMQVFNNDNESQNIPVSSANSGVVINDVEDNPQPGPSGYVPPANNPTPNSTNPPVVAPRDNNVTPTSAVQNKTPNTSTSSTFLTPIAPKPGAIFVKPTQSLLQRPMTQTYLKQSAPARSIPNVSQMMHRKNIMENLNRLAMSRMMSSPPQTGQNVANQSPTMANQSSMMANQSSMIANHTLSVSQSNVSTPMLPPGIAGNPLMGSFTPPRVADLLQFMRPVSVGRPSPYTQDQRPVVKVDNLEKYGKFIQISDIICAKKNSENVNSTPSIINKSHPILCKSLATAPTSEPEKVCIEKLPADGKDAVDTSNDIEASLDSFKISKMRGEDSNNNTSVAGMGTNPLASHAGLAFKNSTNPDNTALNSNNMINPNSMINMNNPGSNSMIKINPGSTMNMNVYKPRNSSTSVRNNALLNLRNTNMNSNNNAFSQRNPPLSTPQGSSTPRNSTSPRKPPVPGLKPLKPLPGLKAINPMSVSPMGQLSVSPKVPSVSPVPSKRLTEEVDISVSPVKNTNPMEITLNSSSDGSEISIVECLTRMDNKFTPITITPNGEDSVTISPIIVNTSNGGGNSDKREPRGVTVFEKLTAIKRLNDGETPDAVAASMNVTIQTLHSWLVNFNKLQKRTVHRGGVGFMAGVGAGMQFSWDTGS
uniref:MGA conserved domain-containing protein n=1 Tax=Cacopsylla melanoneura TaxID=428564 RepID=A0A8D8V9I8_9HEMI